MKNNALIAAHLRSLATERAAAGHSHRANRYLAAALAASSSTMDLASLDSAGVQAALGCRDKIASEVLRVVKALRVLELAESGARVAAAKVLAADLTGQIPEVLRDRCTAVIVAGWDIERCFAAVAAHADRQAIRWLAMATAAHTATDRAAAAKCERVANYLATARPQDFVAARSHELGALGNALAHRLAEYAVANPDKVQDAPVARPDRRVAVGCRTLTVLDGGAVA